MGMACSTSGEKRNAYRILVGKSEGKRPLGKPRYGWQDNIKTDLRETEWGGMDWIDLAQDRDQWSVVVNSQLAASQEGLNSMESVSQRSIIFINLVHVTKATNYRVLTLSYERNLCRSRTSEQSFFNMFRVQSVSIANIVMWLREV
jgi:hypothetical protein